MVQRRECNERRVTLAGIRSSGGKSPNLISHSSRASAVGFVSV
jgi:hypothetical protein